MKDTSMDSTSRVAPLPEPWDPADAEHIGKWGHPAATYDPLLLVRILQRHPRLANRTRAMGESIYVDGRLPDRIRTIAILRTCGQVQCRYEWGGQAAFWGPITGLTGEECDALAVDTQAAGTGWTDAERAVIRAIDALEASGTWDDDTWRVLGEHFDDEQRMELLIVAGWYRTICTLCNAMALPNEDWFRPWPSA
jgi:alkylhydroperoxidase family enzyme